MAGGLVAALAVALAAMVPAHGAPAVETVVLVPGYGMGIGNAITVNYRAHVLFTDGTYTSAPETALSSRPRIDGRWSAQVGGYTLVGSDGRRRQVAGKLQARPAAASQTLDGTYRSIGGAGAAGTGTAVVSAWKAWTFRRDGTLTATQGAGATAGGAATASSAGGSARYRIEGWTLHIRHADGRDERHLFYRYPDSDRSIGVDAQVLSQR